jgi:hypothetical protein
MIRRYRGNDDETDSAEAGGAVAHPPRAGIGSWLHPTNEEIVQDDHRSRRGVVSGSHGTPP